MILQTLPRNSVISAVKTGSSRNTSQSFLKHNLVNDEFMSKLLDRRWALSSPDAKINQIMVLNRKESQLNGNLSFQNITQPCLGEGMARQNQSFPSFYVVRDDLLHPLVNGNKARKLDALLPLLEYNAVTDVVTCGGCQSAHAAAVAVSCAERGIKSHLLLRGEEPETLTGYNLVSKLFGNVIYVPRSVYAKREEMLARHAESVAGHDGSIMWLNDIMEPSSRNQALGQRKFSQVDPVKCPGKSRKVVIINEGAGDAVALLGCMRLVQYLSQNDLFGRKRALKIIVDAGTGTTAVGLALGALYLGLPWDVTAVMLADKIDGYKEKEQNLISEFFRSLTPSTVDDLPSGGNAGIVQWAQLSFPSTTSGRAWYYHSQTTRNVSIVGQSSGVLRFGNILKGEVQECQKIAHQTGILVDPTYTLAAWDVATQLSQNGEEDSRAVMIHTGGTLGMFGLAQRYKSYFQEAAELYKSH